MKHKIITVLAAVIGLSVGGSAIAKQTPISYPADSRIKMVAYHENDVVPVQGRAFVATQIIFSNNEYVLDTEGGDTMGWMVTTPDNETLQNMVFLKPTQLGSNSNITVVTNKHSYYFHVKSASSLKDQDDTTYAIKFVYPEEQRARLNAQLAKRKQKRASILNYKRNPGEYNWDYQFNGSKQIMPLHVFDDGTFTFFELRSNQAVPAVFAVDDRTGKETVVNTRVQGEYLVVQRLAPQFTLRNGKAVASVFNSREIRKLRSRG